MDERAAFAELEIQPTREEEAIRAAYRQKLVRTNPEDDPKGFQRLREAYEAACVWARKEEEEPEENLSEVELEGPVAQWMDQVERLYQNLPERLNPENWRRLVQEDVCLGLDTEEEVRHALFPFLEEHFRLPSEIWQILDEAFLIREEQEEYREWLPGDFVDYMTEQCVRKDSFPYRYFEGDPEADYDGYIRQLLDLIHHLDDHEMEEAAALLESLEASGIRHRWADLEQARYCFLQGDRETAVRQVEELLASGMNTDTRMLMISSDILWESGRREEAVPLCQKILEKMPDHYYANRRLANWYLEQKDYEQARRHCVEAMRVSDSDPALTETLQEINRGLMGGLQERCRNPEDIEAHLELGWCYLQNQLPEQGLALLEPVTPDAEHTAEYHSLMGRLYYTAEQYAQAAEQGMLWRQAIEQENPQEPEEREELPARLAAAWELMAKAHHRMGESQPTFWDQALEEIRQAVRLQPENLSLAMEEASLWQEKKDYRNVVDVCDRMIREDPEFFWGYVIRQEACYHLGRGQEVVDNFYQAKGIFAEYPPLYQWAAKVFLEHGQLEDAADILAQAEEAQAESLELDLLRAAVRRRQAEQSGDYQEAYAFCKKVRQQVKAAGAEKEKLAEIDGELAKCCRRLGLREEGLEVIEEAIRIEPDSRHFWVKANLLAESGKFSDALQLLLLCEKDYGSTAHICWPIARCYERLGKWKSAATYFLKVLEDEPENPDAHGELASLYRRLLESTEDLTYYTVGISHADRQLAIRPEASAFMERGLLHLAASHYQEAQADFQEALRLEPDNHRARNNLGCVYKYTRRLEEAIRTFQQVLAGEGEDPIPQAFGSLAECWLYRGEPEQALAVYRQYQQRFPDRLYGTWGMLEVYERSGRFEEAYRLLEEAFGKNMTPGIRLEQARILAEMGEVRKAIRLCEGVAASGKLADRANRDLGAIWFFERGKPRKAVKYWEKALSLANPETEFYWETAILLMKAYRELQDPRQVRRCFAQILECWRRQYGGTDKFVHSLSSPSCRLYTAAMVFLLAGDRESGEYYRKRLGQAARCRRCTLRDCTDVWKLEALFAMERGDNGQAIQYLERVLEQRQNDRECRYLLPRLEK